MKTLSSVMTLLIAGWLLSSPCLAGPELTLPESAFDFGNVPQHARVSHTFWLKSTGDDTLRIVKVIPGCGCTRTPLESNLLSAGDSTRLEIIFDTRSYRGMTTKRPRIRTNETNPEHTLRITSLIEIRPDSTYPLVISPYKLDLTQFGDKKRKKMKFTISNVSDHDLNLTMISFPANLAEIKLPKKIKAGKNAKGEIRLVGEGLKRPFEKSFTFEVDDSYTTRFTVPVKRNIVTLPEK